MNILQNHLCDGQKPSIERQAQVDDRIRTRLDDLQITELQSPHRVGRNTVFPDQRRDIEDIAIIACLKIGDDRPAVRATEEFDAIAAGAQRDQSAITFGHQHIVASAEIDRIRRAAERAAIDDIDDHPVIAIARINPPGQTKNGGHLH